MESNHLVVDLRGLAVGHSSRVDILTGRPFRIGGNTYSPPDRLSLAIEGGDCRVVVFREHSEDEPTPVVFQVANGSPIATTERARAAIAAALAELAAAPEINAANYSCDDVVNLNSAALKVHRLLSDAVAAKG